MTLEFDIKISDKDMYRFNMHHAYTGFQGIFATVIGLAVLTVAALTRGKVESVYTLLYLVFGVMFLIYMPVSLWMRSKRQILVSPVGPRYAVESPAPEIHRASRESLKLSESRLDGSIGMRIPPASVKVNRVYASSAIAPSTL